MSRLQQAMCILCFLLAVAAGVIFIFDTNAGLVGMFTNVVCFLVLFPILSEHQYKLFREFTEREQDFYMRMHMTRLRRLYLQEGIIYRDDTYLP